MKATQTVLTPSEVCSVCSNLTQIEKRPYCNYFLAFLSTETLNIECDFRGVKP